MEVALLDCGLDEQNPFFAVPNSEAVTRRKDYYCGQHRAKKEQPSSRPQFSMLHIDAASRRSVLSTGTI